MSIRDLFATNKTKAFLTYEARRASSDVEGELPALDLYGQVGLYGRVDYAFNAVYPSEAFLKEVEEEIFALNFVADAYEDFKAHFDKLRALNKLATKNTKFKSIKATAGWRSLPDAHHRYVKVVFDTFFKTYGKNLDNIDIDQFIDEFYRFLKDSKNSLIFSRTSFIESAMYDPLMSGLMIELQEEEKGDDTIKRKYYEDPNFDIYQRVLRIYGFKNDKNHPWRIIADIESAPMLRYMEKYRIDNKTMFDEFFYRSYELDMDVIQEYLREYYNFHQAQVTKRKPAVVTDERIALPTPNFEDGAIQLNDISKYSDLLEQKEVKTKPIQIVNLQRTQEEKGAKKGGTAAGETAPYVAPAIPPITEFGQTLTLVNAGTKYYVTNGNHEALWDMCAIGLTGSCLIMPQNSQIVDPLSGSAKLIPFGGGDPLWTLPHLQTGVGYGNGGITTTSEYAFVLLSRSDGTYGDVNDVFLVRAGISDGLVDWGGQTGWGFFTCKFKRGVSYSEGLDQIACLTADSADEINVVAGSTGSPVGNTSDTPIVDAIYIAWADDDSMFFVAGDTELVGAFYTPFSDAASPDHTLDFSGGVDTVQTYAFPISINERPGRMLSDRNGDGVWLTNSGAVTLNPNYIAHITTNNGTTPSCDLEINVDDLTTMPLVASGYSVKDINVDKFGHVYILILNSNTSWTNSTHLCDIVRIDETGTKVWSAYEDGITLPTGDTTDVYPSSLAVDELGNIYLADEEAYVWSFSQS